MAYRSRLLPRSHGNSRAAPGDTDATDTSGGLSASSLHRRGLGRPGRTTAAKTKTEAPSVAPLLASRGRKAIHIGRLARRSAMVAELYRPVAEGITLAEPLPTAVEATLQGLTSPATPAEAEPASLHEPLMKFFAPQLDAEVWKALRGHDGELFFFGSSAEEELRLGVTFSLDWFGRKTSSYGPSHSSGVMSFCVQNLERSQMYRADNLILCGMLPGPQEPTGDQLQNHLKIVVDDLLELYEHVIIVKTPEHPNGKSFGNSTFFESPLWAGRLPLRVGEPAGGSLTADEYKFAMTGPWAMIIPVVWERFLGEATKEFISVERRYPILMKEYEKKKKAWEKSNKNSGEPKSPTRPRPHMQKGEDENFSDSQLS
ncbi:hypothetical protein B0H14DRAFT_3521066 [Mycena olivaceomarginata]|nr:hypothetical protein B0H14DRAFT_3521066 [Mycena olivaceomarginata]